MANLEKLYKAMHEAEEEVRSVLTAGGDVSRLVSISSGNTKMGKVASVSLLPILTCPARCNGTCGDKCYAKKLALLRPTVARAYARNTVVARLAREEFSDAVNDAMKKVEYFRFHVSGDIPSVQYFRRVVRSCINNPHCQVLLFTKRFEIVNWYIEHENPLPENLHCIQSYGLVKTGATLHPSGYTPLTTRTLTSTFEEVRNMYEWEMTEHERIERYRSEYRRLGLYIFETFEEYMQDREEDEE